jgi:hypothetical protein
MMKLFLLGLLLSTQALAGLPPTSLKGQSDTAAKTTFGFQVPNNQATQISGTNLLIETGSTNEMVNAGFEGGTTGWTASAGTFTTTSTAANLGDGKLTGSWDSSAASQTLTDTALAITSGDGKSSQNYTASVRVKCATGTCTHKLQLYDGTNVLAEATITSSTTQFVRTSVTGSAPASGSIYARLISVASDEPILYIDSGYKGRAEGFNLSQVTQAQFIGSAFIPTTGSCTWNRVSASTGSFTTNASCPGPTVEFNPGPGTIQTTDTDLPQFTVNNLPPGQYQVMIRGVAQGDNATNGSITLELNDGTNTSGRVSMIGSTSSGIPFAAIGTFIYTTAGNRTFSLAGSASANGVNLLSEVNNRNLNFSIWRFPTTPELAYRPDQLPASWSGYHDNTCSWARTNTAYGDPTADATCALVERQNRKLRNRYNLRVGFAGDHLHPGSRGQILRLRSYPLWGGFCQHPGGIFPDRWDDRSPPDGESDQQHNHG